MLLFFISSAVHWTEREPDPCYHQERQPISLLNLLSPRRGKGMGLLKGNVIIPAMSATLHISEAADGSPRRVVTLLTTSLMLSSFSRNLNNCPIPWVYWTWFVFASGKTIVSFMPGWANMFTETLLMQQKEDTICVKYCLGCRRKKQGAERQCLVQGSSCQRQLLATCEGEGKGAGLSIPTPCSQAVPRIRKSFPKLILLFW